MGNRLPGVAEHYLPVSIVVSTGRVTVRISIQFHVQWQKMGHYTPHLYLGALRLFESIFYFYFLFLFYNLKVQYVYPFVRPNSNRTLFHYQVPGPRAQVVVSCIRNP
jgi:hypothetical protein